MGRKDRRAPTLKPDGKSRQSAGQTRERSRIEPLDQGRQAHHSFPGSAIHDGSDFLYLGPGAVERRFVSRPGSPDEFVERDLHKARADDIMTPPQAQIGLVGKGVRQLLKVDHARLAHSCAEGGGTSIVTPTRNRDFEINVSVSGPKDSHEQIVIFVARKTFVKIANFRDGVFGNQSCARHNVKILRETLTKRSFRMSGVDLIKVAARNHSSLTIHQVDVTVDEFLGL